MNHAFEELCMVNARRSKLTAAAAQAAQALAYRKDKAATDIQRRFRGMLGRREGIPRMRALRFAVRESAV